MSEYRGYQIVCIDGRWYAEAGGGMISLGPFKTERQAQKAVDEDLDDYRGEGV